MNLYLAKACILKEEVTIKLIRRNKLAQSEYGKLARLAELLVEWYINTYFPTSYHSMSCVRTPSCIDHLPRCRINRSLSRMNHLSPHRNARHIYHRRLSYS
ncbi:MAG: hypothetical protein K6A35_10970 [bacterium]|nr:hypothetical protein [bacterium]